MSDAYVADDGNNGGAGSSGDPYLDGDTGMADIADPGDTLFFYRADQWDYSTHGSAMILYKEAVNGTSGNKINIATTGGGALPIFNVGTSDIGTSVFVIKLQDCDYWTIDRMDIRNVGSQTENASSEGGGIQIKSSADGWVNNCNFDEIHDEAIVLQSMPATADHLEDSNTINNAGYWHLTNPTVNKYMMGASGSSSNPNGMTLTCSNNQIETVNRGENITVNRGRFIIEDNECLGNTTANLYIDTANFNTGISVFRRNLGYDGNQACSGCEFTSESFQTSGAKHDSIHVTMNAFSGFEQGVRWDNNNQALQPDPCNEMRYNKNSFCDCDVTWSCIQILSNANDSQAYHNISMPLAVNTIHDNGDGLPTGFDADYNYWHNSRDTTRHADWTGSNDIIASTQTLTDTTSMRSAATISDVVIEDFRPLVSLVSGTLNDPMTGSNYTTYDLVENHDEYGALLEVNAPEPPADPPGNVSPVSIVIR